MATTSERRRHAIKNGYRSGLEDDIAKDLKDRGVDFEYEKLKSTDGNFLRIRLTLLTLSCPMVLS